MCGANLSVMPGRRQIFDEPVQVLAGLGSLLAPASNLLLYEISLTLTNLIQKVYGVQLGKRLAKLFLAFVRNPVIGEKPLIRRRRTMSTSSILLRPLGSSISA